MKRPLLAIHATSIADFRAQLDAAVAQAQRLDGVPVLPSESTGSDAALVMALADAIEALCVVELPATKKAA
jgi:hypothetical protein